MRNLLRGLTSPLMKNRFSPEYQRYLKSPAWEFRRQVLFAKRGKRCEVCYTWSGPHQIHHLNYDNLGREPLADLVILCARCHRDLEKLHYKMGKHTDRRVVFHTYKNRRR